MTQASLPDEPWFVQAFDRIYLELYPHRNDAEAETHADDLVRLLQVRPGQRVLDVACGAGRYARALGRRGLRVTGVDLSPALLEEARERSPMLPGAPSYLRCDVRELPFHGQFEGALSMFTSFGYTESRADDVRMLEGVARALVPGGRFLLDFLNPAVVRAGLQPVSNVSTRGLRVRMERRIEDDAAGGPRVLKRVRAVDAQTGVERAHYEESVRLYTADEIDGLLVEGGLAPLGERLGGLDGTPFTPDAPRLVRVASAPRRGR